MPPVDPRSAAGTIPPTVPYVDKGNLATIGRAKAVADIKGIRVGGFPAWVIWLVVHLWYLIGFRIDCSYDPLDVQLPHARPRRSPDHR